MPEHAGLHAGAGEAAQGGHALEHALNGAFASVHHPACPLLGGVFGEHGGEPLGDGDVVGLDVDQKRSAGEVVRRGRQDLSQRAELAVATGDGGYQIQRLQRGPGDHVALAGWTGAEGPTVFVDLTPGL